MRGRRGRRRQGEAEEIGEEEEEKVRQGEAEDVGEGEEEEEDREKRKK